jgi:hypothetical protein
MIPDSDTDADPVFYFIRPMAVGFSLIYYFMWLKPVIPIPL